jgi:hypothetical protein
MNEKLVLIGFCFQEVPKLKKIAEDEGLRVKVLYQASEVIPTLKKHNTKYLVGLCCPDQTPFMEKILDREGFVYKSVVVHGNGVCVKKGGVRGKISMKEYREALKWLKKIKS